MRSGMGLNWICFRGLGEIPPIEMPSSDEGQEESEQGVFCGAHLPEEAPPFGRGASLNTYPIFSSLGFWVKVNYYFY